MARTREETVAVKMFDLLSDVRLDTYMIGFYLAHSPDPNIHDVLAEVMEVTNLTKTERQDRIKEMILGEADDLG